MPAIGASLLLALTLGTGTAPATTSSVALGAAPLAVAAADGAVWVVVETPRSAAVLWRLDSRTGRRVASFRIGPAGPDMGAVSSSGGTIWAAAGERLIEVDAASSGVVGRVRLPGVASAVTAGFGSVWIAVVGPRRNLLVRLDARTLRPRARFAVADPAAVRAGLGSVWVADASSLLRIDPRADRLLATATPVTRASDLAVAGDRVWVLDQAGAVSVDRRGRPRRRIALPFAAGRIAVASGRLWATNDCGCGAGRLAVLDLRTRRLLVERRIGETPVGVATAGAHGWIVTFGDERLFRVVAP